MYALEQYWAATLTPLVHFESIELQTTTKKNAYLNLNRYFFFCRGRKKNVQHPFNAYARAIKKYHRIAFPNCAMCVHSTRNPYICSLRLA